MATENAVEDVMEVELADDEVEAADEEAMETKPSAKRDLIDHLEAETDSDEGDAFGEKAEQPKPAYRPSYNQQGNVGHDPSHSVASILQASGTSLSPCTHTHTFRHRLVGRPRTWLIPNFHPLPPLDCGGRRGPSCRTTAWSR